MDSKEKRRARMERFMVLVRMERMWLSRILLMLLLILLAMVVGLWLSGKWQEFEVESVEFKGCKMYKYCQVLILGDFFLIFVF